MTIKELASVNRENVPKVVIELLPEEGASSAGMADLSMIAWKNSGTVERRPREHRVAEAWISR